MSSPANIQQRAFRIWVVVAVLWVGFNAWARWDELLHFHIAGCSQIDRILSGVSQAPPQNEVGEVEGGCRNISSTECVDQKTGKHWIDD
jgi:hypothetical protein